MVRGAGAMCAGKPGRDNAPGRFANGVPRHRYGRGTRAGARCADVADDRGRNIGRVGCALYEAGDRHRNAALDRHPLHCVDDVVQIVTADAELGSGHRAAKATLDELTERSTSGVAVHHTVKRIGVPRQPHIATPDLAVRLSDARTQAPWKWSSYISSPKTNLHTAAVKRIMIPAR